MATVLKLQPSNGDFFYESAFGRRPLLIRLEVQFNRLANVLPCFFEGVSLGNNPGKAGT
jgi:hypothetical protein